MNHTGSSCLNIYNNIPETSDKSGYYRINGTQWTYCNLTEISITVGDFLPVCAGVGGGWRRITHFDISAGDECPSGWIKRYISYSGASATFCRGPESRAGCNSAMFSTNGTSYQGVCGRARGYQKGQTRAFFAYHQRDQTTIDKTYADAISITYGNRPRHHI